MALCDLVESQKNTLQRLTHCLSEADKNRCDLLKDLEEERQKNAELASVVLSAKPLEEAVKEKNSKDSQVNMKLYKIAAIFSVTIFREKATNANKFLVSQDIFTTFSHTIYK